MNKKLITSLAVMLFLAFGSAQAGEWKSGAIAGFNDALLYIPSSYAPRPAEGNKRSLVIHLMGCGQVIEQIKTSSGWEQAAEAYGMYVLIPTPLNPAFPNKQGPKVKCWNYGYDGGFGAAVPTPNSTDNKAVIAAPGKLMQQYSDIDPNQVYVAGLSAGAAIAQQVACMAPDVFHGVGNAAGPGLNSRQGQAVSPVAGAGMAAPQPTQASMEQQCNTWIGGKTADFKNQIWSIVSDNNFLPVGNLTQDSNMNYTFDMFNDGSIWDGDKFAPTEYHTRTFGMIKNLVLNNAFTEENEIVAQSTESSKGTGCGDQAATVTFTGLIAGTRNDAAPVQCMPNDAERRHWKAKAVHLRAPSGHIQLSRIEQDTLKHSWPVGVENTANWLACIGEHAGYEITMDQIANKDHENYSVLKDPATGLWKADAVAQLENGAIGCIYFNSFSVNYPMYLAQLWNNNNPKLGEAQGNNKLPTLIVDASASGFSVTVSGTAIDEDGSIASLVISMTNKTTGTNYGPETVSVNSAGYYTFTFNGLTDGRHDVTVSATDNEGEATVKTQGVAVGNIPNNAPVLESFTAASEEKGCISFSGKASDSDGSINAVTISIIGRDNVAATVSGGNFTAKVCDLPLGRTFSGFAVATDDLGALSNEKSFSVLVPMVTACESVTGTVAKDFEKRPDLVESRVEGFLTYFYTTGDNQRVNKFDNTIYTIFIGNDGKGYLVDPENCGANVEMFTVTASVNGDGTITPSTQQVGSGEAALLLVRASEGKKIETVTGCGGSLTDDIYTTGPVTASCSVTATFVDDGPEPVFHTVTLGVSGGNGTISPSGAQQVEEGKTLAFSVAPAANYKVKAVSGCGAMKISGNNYTTGAVNSSCTVTATFELEAVAPKFFTVTLSAGANGSVSPSGSQTVQEGGTQSFAVNPASGYEVNAVNGCGAMKISGNNYKTAAVNADCTVTVSFKKLVLNHKVTINVGANGSASPAGIQSVIDGKTISFAVNPATGYKLGSVQGCGISATTGNVHTTAPVLEDCTVNVSFVPAEVMVKVNLIAGSNGTIDPSGVQSVSKGSRLDFTINPDFGYTGTVSGCGATPISGNDYTIAAVNSDCTVTASFVAVTAYHNVTLTAGENGTVTPSGINSVAEGADLPFTVQANTGYIVDEVTGSCGFKELGQGKYTTESITSDCNVSVTFKLATQYYTLTLNADSQGTISPSGSQDVLEGSKVEFSVTATEAGYKIDTVQGEGCDVEHVTGNSYRTAAMTGDCTVTATFVEISTPPPAGYTVTATAGDGGKIDPAFMKDVSSGAMLDFKVSADNGFYIAAVNGCGGTSDVFTKDSITTTYTTGAITENCTVTASFTKKQVASTGGGSGVLSPLAALVLFPGLVLLRSRRRRYAS